MSDNYFLRKYGNPGTRGVPIGLQDPAMDVRRPQAEADLEGKRTSTAKTNQDMRLDPRRVATSEGQLALEREKFVAQRRDDAMKRKAFDDARAQAILEITDTIKRLDGLGSDARDTRFLPEGTGETGYIGSLLRSIPGTAAYDLGQDVDTVGGRAAFERLQRMREMSPTGGAVGNVSDKDMALLKSTLGSLDPNQSQGNFLKNVTSARDLTWNVLNRIDPRTAARLKPPPRRQAGSPPRKNRVIDFGSM